MGKRPAVNWSAIETDYRAGVKTDRVIAKEHGISHTAVQKRARKGGWSRDLMARGSRVRTVKLQADAEPPDGAGFVYVIYLEAEGRRHFKIGSSQHFDARLKTHQTSSPFDLHVAICYFVGQARAEEKALHAAFSGKRLRGEWFALDEADLFYVANRSLLTNG